MWLLIKKDEIPSFGKGMLVMMLLCGIIYWLLLKPTSIEQSSVIACSSDVSRGALATDEMISVEPFQLEVEPSIMDDSSQVTDTEPLGAESEPSSEPSTSSEPEEKNEGTKEADITITPEFPPNGGDESDIPEIPVEVEEDDSIEVEEIIVDTQETDVDSVSVADSLYGYETPVDSSESSGVVDAEVTNNAPVITSSDALESNKGVLRIRIKTW